MHISLDDGEREGCQNIMILHYYTPEVPLAYCTHVHNGHGIGSIFARIFGKIASKTAVKVAAKSALKAAISAGKAVGKKALKTAVKQGVPLLKEGIKRGITEATKYGTEATLQGINSLTQKAISKGVPPSIAQNISRAVQKGAITTAEKIGETAKEKLHTGIDRVAHQYTAAPKRKREPSRKEPRKSPGPSRKRKKSSLSQSLIDAL